MKRLTAVLLTLGIILAIVADSADFFFHRPYYEYWDLAANSLSVLRAKHFSELYGSYSRWGFHHPGPVFFYLQALGEWLFFDCLHLTPAPFNAQTLANLCMTAAFYMAALRVFSQWLDASARHWFIPAALAMGVLHFGAVSRLPSYDMLTGSSVFTSAWTAHSWVFPFLCMLVAGASVAAGRGQELPLLALADGFLIHAHIAAPMFVGPVTLLAYGGLLLSAARSEGWDGLMSWPLDWRRYQRAFGAAWRAFPRRHVVALGILAVFALPLVIDLFLGDGSNFHAVLMHMRTHHGEHKTLVRSFFYFLQFGAYRPYKTHLHLLKKFDGPGAYAYVWSHKKIYAAWIVGVMIVVWAAVARPLLIVLRHRRNSGMAEPGAESGAPSDRALYLAWAGVFLLLSIVLTLYWGIIQDGDMFYYSGWINFAIYYFGLLIVLAELSAFLAAGVRRWRNGALLRRAAWTWIEWTIPVGVVATTCVLNADRFRVRDPAPETNRAMHESNVRAVRDAIARNPTGIKLFDCPFFAWPAVTSIALEMARQGQPFMVVNGLSVEHFSIPFGRDHAQRSVNPQQLRQMELWRFRLGEYWRQWASGTPRFYRPLGKILEQQLAAAGREMASTGEVAFYPLLDNVELRIGVPIIRPEDGSTLDFHKGSRDADTALYGFGDAETWGTWSVGQTGALRLRGQTVDSSADVEVSLDAHPFLAPDADVDSQRLNLAVNGTTLGPVALLSGDETLVYKVPGAMWNRTFGQDAGAALEFEFPDAASPAALGVEGNNDGRTLGVGLHAIHFRRVPAVHDRPALELDGSARQTEVSFKPGGNAGMFTDGGWYDPESWGTWSSGHESTLRFHSKIIDGTRDVEVTLDIHAVMNTDSPIKGQRVRAYLNDVQFDYERTLDGAGTLTLCAPAKIWNRAVADNAEAVLRLELPDAVSPARIDLTGKEQDGRLLGLGIERIRFRDVPAPVVTTR